MRLEGLSLVTDRISRRSSALSRRDFFLSLFAGAVAVGLPLPMERPIEVEWTAHDLRDVIFNIAPAEVPFMAVAKRGSPRDWVFDKLTRP